MNSKFPLLRAPQLVLSKIINLSDPGELVNIALCSKRAFKTVKTHVKKWKNMSISMVGCLIKISIKGETALSFQASVERKCEFKEYEITELRDLKYRELLLFIHRVRNDAWRMTSDNRIKDEVLIVFDWITELFPIEFSVIRVNEDDFYRVEWMEKRQKKIDELSCSKYEDGFSNDQIRYLIDCNADSLHLGFNPHYSFKYEGSLPTRKCLRIFSGGLWFTPYHLMTIDVVNLVVYRSKITNFDLNQFLKHRLTGGSSRLKCLKIEIEELDINEISDGIREYLHLNRAIETQRPIANNIFSNGIAVLHYYVRGNVFQLGQDTQ